MLLLRNMGHEVVCYSDGESFLSLARPRPGDDVIVDLKLPGISGAEIITALLQLDQPPRIIAMTGQGATAIRNELRGINVSHVLRKPLNADQLAACLAPVGLPCAPSD